MLKQAPLPFALAIVHAIKHVAIELDRASPSALSFDELRQTYQHPLPSDLFRVRVNNNLDTDDEAHDWIIRHAVGLLSEWLFVKDNRVEFKFNTDFDDLRWDKKPIIRPGPDIHKTLRDPFNKMSGEFTENIRQKLGKLDDLRESMKEWGWIDHPAFRAIGDIRTRVILTGHRRIAVAKELGINWEKYVEWIDIGDGDDADALRFQLAIASNYGSQPLSTKDRERLSMYLYGEKKWSMQRIAAILNLAVSTIHEDLKDYTPPEKPNRPKGGRPKGSKKPKGPSEERQRADAAIEELYSELGRRPTEKEVCERAKVSSTPVRSALAVWDSKQPTRAPQEAPNEEPAPEDTPTEETAPAATSDEPVTIEYEACCIACQLLQRHGTPVRH